MGVRLEGVSKRFGRFVAVDQLSLDVRDGEFLSIVGPSGCGKTTTLRLVAGFLVPDEGRVWLGETAVNHLPARLRNVGIVFQNYALFPNMTVFDNVAFGLRARRLPEAQVRARVGEMLEMVGLADRARAYPKQLSGGQQQRTALARALAIRPRVLLLDEPLSALDAKVRLNLRYELRRIQREAGITTIYVTHDQEEALSISDRVAVMDRGRIRQIDTPERIYRLPADGFVADFIGITNLLKVTPLGPDRVEWQGHVLHVNPDRRPGEGRRAGPLGDGGVSPPREPGRGGQFRLAVRPEQLRLVRPDDRDGTGGVVNRLRGVVTGRIFLGPTVRLAVDVAGERLLVDVPYGSQAAFPVDSEVDVTFEPDAVRILDD